MPLPPSCRLLCGSLTSSTGTCPVVGAEVTEFLRRCRRSPRPQLPCGGLSPRDRHMRDLLRVQPWRSRVSSGSRGHLSCTPFLCWLAVLRVNVPALSSLHLPGDICGFQFGALRGKAAVNLRGGGCRPPLLR